MFVVPNSRWFGKRCWMWFTPSATILVPILRRHGLTVEVLEANIDNLTSEQVRERIAAFGPDVVGITNMSLEYWRQPHHVAQIVKSVDPKIITVMGGVHATTLPQRVMEDPNIDFAILREGEERLPRFLDILAETEPNFAKMDGVAYRENGQTVIVEPTSWIDDLDALPLPDYDLFDWNKVMNFQQQAAGALCPKRTPVGAVMTSRGCPYRCCFCAGWRAMGRKARVRSADNVLNEIDMLVSKYGIREVVFQDDEMYVDRQRSVDIIEGIGQRHRDLIWKNLNLAYWDLDYELVQMMKRSGCYQITISPESGCERVLKEIIHKPAKLDHAREVIRWCREMDIETEGEFVIGFPGETWDEILQTIRFAEELDADAVKFALATPFPGTELAEVAMERGLIPRDFDFYRDDALGFACGVLETDEFTVPELQMLRCFEWDRINFKSPEKIARYARYNRLTVEQIAEFRRKSRRNVGKYYPDQAAAERIAGDEARIGSILINEPAAD